MPSLVLLTGCGASLSAKTNAPAVVEPAVVAAPPPPAPAKVDPRERLVTRLLAQAEYALSQDQLTTPEYDNAVDRYRAVLLVAPKEPRAQAGLEKVVQRYCQMAMAVGKLGDYGKAASFLATAEGIVADSNSIASTRAALVELRRTQPEEEEEVALESKGEPLSEIKLPTKALANRDQTLTSSLAQLAQRVQKSDLFVLIVSRTDAEGRWIYQQMKEAVPGYRLRGNIQLGREPKIVLQAL
ncbi:hypothetical protein [Halioxenophilus sp. WMMB6]|uniref:hypothetical protein n=1 Tax=Halioxenophilus sp. WMMB6 TaxID=3073815 RepID=UPI00295ED805|nr:hypothetical protein [Halioxenophilus sp. WMMB6]